MVLIVDIVLGLFGLILFSSAAVWVFCLARAYFRSLERRNKFLVLISKLSSSDRKKMLSDLREAKDLADIYDRIEGGWD